MKTIRRSHKLLITCMVFSLLPATIRGMRPSTIRSATALHLQESGVGAPLGKIQCAA